MSQMSSKESIEDVGAIARMELPEGWIELKSSTPDPGGFNLTSSSSRDFSPADPSAVLSLFYRGTLVSEGSAERFEQLLNKKDHELSTEEIDSINQILSKLADEDAFQKRTCYTLNIRGRRVLVVDGEWNKSQTQFHGIMLGVDESGRVIQEVFFEAPVGTFEKYLNEVKNAIGSIEWRGR